jgi:NTE family protein
LEQILDDIGLDDIVDIPKELVRDGEFVLDRKNFNVLLQYRKKILKNRGLDTSPLRKKLKLYLDETKIRKSKIDLGIITYQLNELKPFEIFIDQMDEGYVIDYLLASASLPGFAATKISSNQFIDGGVYNNIPYETARRRGYKNIILVDISGLGINRRPDIKNTRTVYIKNSINMGGVLDFNKKFMRKFKKLGYLDTLHIYNRLTGWKYFIVRDDRIEKKT